MLIIYSLSLSSNTLTLQVRLRNPEWTRDASGRCLACRRCFHKWWWWLRSYTATNQRRDPHRIV